MYGDATKKRLLLTSSVLSSNVTVKLLVQRYHQDSGIEHLRSNLDACCRCSREHPVYLRRHKICLDWYGVHVKLKCKHIPRFVNDRAARRLLFVQKLNFTKVNF